MIDAFASEAHYADHLIPIWNALTERGTFWACGTALDRLDSARLDPRPSRRPMTDRRIMVAAYRDLWNLPGAGHVLVEHGAGQTYSNWNPSYSGGRGRENVGLFICPSERVAALNRRRYPDAPAVAVGVPALDYWHEESRSHGDAIALSWHWNAPIVPESRTAFGHYRAALPLLAREFPGIIGHAHPRIFRQIAPVYERAGIEPVESFAEVLERAWVYVCDNSSTIFEFASLDRPVVLLNAPWYRRDVEHGLRFWEFANVGVQVEDPADLVYGIRWARANPQAIARDRRDVIQQVYEATDGKAADRAARAIEEIDA